MNPPTSPTIAPRAGVQATVSVPRRSATHRPAIDTSLATRAMTPGTVARGSVPRTSLEAPWDRLRVNLSSAARSQGDDTATPSALPLPEPGPWAGAVVRATIEALLGTRTATQVERWLAPDLYEAVRRRAGLAMRVLGRSTLPHAPRVLSCHAQPCHRSQDVEVSVVIHDGTKVRAAAIRLEAFRGRWRAVALEIG